MLRGRNQAATVMHYGRLTYTLTLTLTHPRGGTTYFQMPKRGHSRTLKSSHPPTTCFCGQTQLRVCAC